MSAEFLPVWIRLGISISSMAASCIDWVYGAESAPVGIRLLDDDLPLLDQPFQHAHDVKAIAAILKPEREVLEIDEYRER